MFNDIIKAYADAMYVATTLRPPVSAARAGKSDGAGDGEASRRTGGWLRTWFGRGFGATAAPTPPIRPSVMRAPVP